MRSRFGGLALVAVALGCGASAARPVTASPQTDDLETFARAAIDHIDSGELEWFRSTSDPDATMYDANRRGPVSAHGREEVLALIDEFQRGIDAGTSFRSTIERLSCRPFPGGGICTIEIRQTATTDGVVRGPFRERITLVVRSSGGRLVWMHWHASESAAHAASLQPEPTAAVAEDRPVLILRTAQPLGRINPARVHGVWVVVAADEARHEYEFTGWIPPGQRACSECDGPPPPIGMPVHTAVTFAEPEFFTLQGPRPTYRDTAQCPDQTPCWADRPFPDGRYRLIAEGNLVSCPVTFFEVPITDPVVITCTRLAPPDP